jgi:aryl-alcohol dehydrogenase-like predicted oxidoreductase
VRFLGVSEAAPATVRRAHAVHPLCAVQNEYSLFTRDPEDSLFATLRELGIGLVAYSPLGRGFLTGSITSPDHFTEGDARARNPRFVGENFAKNLAVVERVGELARDKGVTASQLALAWVLAQGNDVVALPGSRTRAHLDENAAAADIELSRSDLESIEDIAPKGVASGERYPEADMAHVNL